ncbi:EamA family transporter [Halobacteriaceae archaeon GCM10025711]
METPRPALPAGFGRTLRVRKRRPAVRVGDGWGGRAPGRRTQRGGRASRLSRLRRRPGTGGFRSSDRRSYGYFAVSGGLTAIALLSLFGALALPAGRVAIVESLASTAPLFTTVFAYFLLRDLERVTRGVVVGAVLVVVGAALVTLEPAAVV